MGVKQKATDFFKKVKKMATTNKKDAELDYKTYKNFRMGYFYVFNYTAKTPIKIIEYYDKNPIIYVLNYTDLKDGKGILAINFNWVPQEVRKQALKVFLGANPSGSGKNKLIKGEKLKIQYKNVKRRVALQKYFSFAIRTYYINKSKNIISIGSKDFIDNIEYNEAIITGSKTKAKKAIKIALQQINQNK